MRVTKQTLDETYQYFPATRTGPSIAGNGDEDDSLDIMPEDALDHAENAGGGAVVAVMALVGVVAGAVGGAVVVWLLYAWTR